MENNSNFEVVSSEENKNEQIGFADKVIGIISSPNEILTKLSKKIPSASDWVIPVIIMFLVVGISNVIYFYTPDLKEIMQEKQYETIEKSLNEKVESGDLTPEQAKKQIAAAKEQMEKFGVISIVFQIFFSGITLFISVIIINGVFFLLIKFVMQGEGNFNTALSAYGSVYYILILQAIFALLMTLILGKFVTGFNLYSFSDMDMFSFEGFIFRKLDLFLIWFYVLLGISYAKFFKSKNTTAYITLVFAVWIISNAIFYYLSTMSPYFQGFIM